MDEVKVQEKRGSDCWRCDGKDCEGRDSHLHFDRWQFEKYGMGVGILHSYYASEANWMRNSMDGFMDGIRRYGRR